MANYAEDKAIALDNQGFPPVMSWSLRPKISVSEKGKFYRVTLAKGIKSAVFQVDGNIITQGLKCDKFIAAVRDGNGAAVFLELKGKDVGHAIDQLEYTITDKAFKPLPKKGDEVRARIVTMGCGPASASKAKLEKARIRFRQRYNIELRTLKNNQEDLPIAL